MRAIDLTTPYKASYDPARDEWTVRLTPLPLPRPPGGYRLKRKRMRKKHDKHVKLYARATEIVRRRIERDLMRDVLAVGSRPYRAKIDLCSVCGQPSTGSCTHPNVS